MTTTEKQGWEEDFIEKGADLEHTRWAKWQEYLHSKCVEHENGMGEWVCFPSERFRHWERQIATPYSELSEKEKESDRHEVRQYLPLIREIFSQEIENAKRDVVEFLTHAGTLDVPNDLWLIRRKDMNQAALQGEVTT
jgi:hypothetical protein